MRDGAGGLTSASGGVSADDLTNAAGRSNTEDLTIAASRYNADATSSSTCELERMFPVDCACNSTFHV